MTARHDKTTQVDAHDFKRKGWRFWLCRVCELERQKRCNARRPERARV